MLKWDKSGKLRPVSKIPVAAATPAAMGWPPSCKAVTPSPPNAHMGRSLCCWAVYANSGDKEAVQGFELISRKARSLSTRVVRGANAQAERELLLSGVL